VGGAYHIVATLGQPGNDYIVECHKHLAHEDSKVRRTFLARELRYPG
jgi:hypothetical protein